MQSGNTTTGPSRLDTLSAVGLALFLLLLPFHLVIKRLLPGPFGTYWKEVLIGILVVLWIIRSRQSRRFLLTDTPLDQAVLIYLGLLVLRFVLERLGWTSAWGLYVSVMYLPLFWLVPAVLRYRPGWVTVFVSLLVSVGGVVALGGLAEFVLDVPLWPSDEPVLVRQACQWPSSCIGISSVKRQSRSGSEIYRGQRSS